jgi:hypothetical protein
MLRMAMVTPALACGASVNTIEKADLNFMRVILGERRRFVNGIFVR